MRSPSPTPWHRLFFLAGAFAVPTFAQTVPGIEPDLPYSEQPGVERTAGDDPSLSDPEAIGYYKAGSPQDVRVKTARALAAEKRYMSASIELIGTAGGKPLDEMPEEFQWLMGDAYMGFSVLEARRLYRLAGVGSNDSVRYARTQMLIADQDFRRGRFDAALRTLNALRDSLPEAQLNAWKYQVTRVLLAKGQYGDAIQMLQELVETDDGSRFDPFVQYNLGLALINDGRALEGRDTLDRVGRMPARTEIEHAIRDRANLVLGWHFLQNEQGGTAKATLQRIRAEGASSSRALLGLGWAELQPRGDRQIRTSRLEDENDPFNSLMTLGGVLRPGFIEDGVFRRSGFAIYSRAKMGDDEEESLQRALAAWTQLMDRDPMDPAVQEAALAIPYTLDRIGAYTQALEYYEKAIDLLELNRKRQRAAQESIESGVMLNTLVLRDANDESSRDWQLRDLPDVPETYYLQSLLASHRFQEGLKSYRDLRLLGRTVEAWQDRLDRVLHIYRRNNREPVEPELLFAAAKLDRKPVREDIVLTLKADPTLAPPGRYQRPPDFEAEDAVRLRPATVPGRFSGSYEQAVQLRDEASVLQRQLELAVNEQLLVLNDIALSELSEQQLTIEKYLVEARFALARLYDRERQTPGPAPESEDEAP
ncbi:tetratricopeptide repeat protein [Polycyclovorans algicola]|uniref:tetratricopeptide repeat protein n=1 Tax=Polycyclovorans algicola TaxID=616992 RepID=UPI0004A6F48C|nr:tetratricopeptide repeat protein [Polycyclovorans algicola]